MESGTVNIDEICYCWSGIKKLCVRVAVLMRKSRSNQFSPAKLLLNNNIWKLNKGTDKLENKNEENIDIKGANKEINCRAEIL